MIQYIQAALLLTIGPVAAVGYGATEKNLLYNEKSRLTVDNINRATEVLRDPSVAGENLRHHLDQVAGKARTQAEDAVRSVDRSLEAQAGGRSKIKDPTKISGSFRAALGNMTVRQTTAITTTGASPQLPKISLAAIVYGNDQTYHAMLHVDDRTVLIREGDKTTFMDNDKLVEIVVQEITRSDIRLAVYPSNQLIVLR